MSDNEWGLCHVFVLYSQSNFPLRDNKGLKRSKVKWSATHWDHSMWFSDTAALSGKLPCCQSEGHCPLLSNKRQWKTNTKQQQDGVSKRSVKVNHQSNRTFILQGPCRMAGMAVQSWSTDGRKRSGASWGVWTMDRHEATVSRSRFYPSASDTRLGAKGMRRNSSVGGLQDSHRNTATAAEKHWSHSRSTKVELLARWIVDNLVVSD